MYLSDFFSNFKLFCCLDFPFLYIFTKIFMTYWLLLPFFLLYKNKCSSILNGFFYGQIFYGSGWLNGETFFSLKGSCLIQKGNKYYNFFNVKPGGNFTAPVAFLYLLRICKKYIEYFIIPNTSTFIRLSHLYQEFCVHWILINQNLFLPSIILKKVVG